MRIEEFSIIDYSALEPLEAPVAASVVAPVVEQPADVYAPTAASSIDVPASVVLPAASAEPTSSVVSLPEATSAEPDVAAYTMAAQLASDAFVPANQAIADTTSSALTSLADTYAAFPAPELEATISQWLAVGQEVLDAGTWRPTEPSGMSAGELARRAQYEALGYTPAQIESSLYALSQFAARNGMSIDDIRVAASAPGMSAMEWGESLGPTTNPEGIVAFDRGSGNASSGGAEGTYYEGYSDYDGYAGYDGAELSDEEVVSYLQSFQGYGGYAGADQAGATQAAYQQAVGDLYAEYTMRDLPLYCFEYSERLRDALASSAPETSPVVLEFPAAEENGMNHYAVQIDTPDGPRVLDITADQFSILNGGGRVGPEMRTREDMERVMSERGFQAGRPADMSPPEPDGEP